MPSNSSWARLKLLLSPLGMDEIRIFRTKVPGLYCRWIFPQENSLFATNPHFWRSFASADAVSNNCKISWFLSCTACRIGGPPGSQALGSSPERLRDSLWMSIICNCQICNIFGDCVVVVIVLVAKYSSYFSCYSYCSCYFYYSHYSDYSCQSWYSYSYCLLLFYVPLMLFPMFLPITRLLLRLILLLVLIAATVVIFVPVGVSASVVFLLFLLLLLQLVSLRLALWLLCVFPNWSHHHSNDLETTLGFSISCPRQSTSRNCLTSSSRTASSIAFA